MDTTSRLSATVLAFLERVMADREAGNVRPVEFYAALFPGSEGVIRDSYEQFLGTGDDTRSETPGTPARPRIGRYELIEVLGRGGQGMVYLAEDRRLGRKVALKILHGAAVGAKMKFFEREAQVVSQLEHPGVCGLFDSGQDGEVAWIAMRYVPGETLAQRLKLKGAAKTRESIHETLRFFAKVADALHACHEVGIIHRDIKPQNIMATPAGDPTILDFGVARLQGTEAPSLTGTGDLVGTPAYMSPEQVAGAELDRRTDIYALGVTLFEALTGRLPFAATTLTALLQAIDQTTAPNAQSQNQLLPKDAATVISKCLEKERSRRYATAAELAQDLRAVLEDRPISARRVGTLGRIWRFCRREPKTAALIAALIVAVPAATGLLTERIVDAPRRAAQLAAEQKEERDFEMARGWFDLEERRLDSAQSVFRGVASRFHPDAEAETALFLIALQRGKIVEAESQLARARGLLPAAAMNLLESDLLRAQGNLTEAAAREALAPQPITPIELHLASVRDLSQALRCPPRDADALFRRAYRWSLSSILQTSEPRISFYAQLARAIGNTNEPATRMVVGDAIAQVWPALATAHQLAATAYYAHRAQTKWHFVNEPELMDRAVLATERALMLSPTLGSAWNTLGVLQTAQGRIPKAILALEKALTLDPKSALTRVNLATALQTRADATSFHLTGVDVFAPSRRGHTAEERADLERALNLLAEAVALDSLMPDAHLAYGAALIAAGKPGPALVACKSAVTLNPNDPSAHLNLASAQTLTQDLAGAEASLRRAIALQPDFSPAHVNLSNVLQAKGDLDGAIAAIRQAVAFNPKLGMAHNQLGLLLQSQGNNGGAIAAFHTAIECEPSLALAHSNLGRAVEAEGDLDAAMAHYRRATEANPELVEAWINLGGALQSKGALDEAIAAFHRALKIDPDRAEAHCVLGLAHLEELEFDKALHHLRRGHELGSKLAHWSYPSAKWIEDAERRRARADK